MHIYPRTYACTFQDFKLKLSAVTLLEVMCEEIHMETKKLVLNIYNSVDISALHGTIDFFKKMVGNYSKCILRLVYNI